MRNAHRLILGVALVLLGAGAASAVELAGTEWRPVQVGDIAWPEDSHASVRFETDEQVTGHGGCNTFFGRYQVTGEQIELGPLSATRRACPRQVMDREKLLLDALEGRRRFVLDRGGDVLTFSDLAGKSVAVFQQRNGANDLAGTSWRPTTSGEATWPERSQAFLQFKEDGQLEELQNAIISSASMKSRARQSLFEPSGSPMRIVPVCRESWIVSGSCGRPSSTREHSIVTASG